MPVAALEKFELSSKDLKLAANMPFAGKVTPMAKREVALATNPQLKGGEELLLKKGFKPTPMDFIQLVQVDPEFANRFCYCNRVENEGQMFDFEVVPFKNRNDSEYLTISARGIVHFVKGEATFMSIPEWEREARLFSKITNISFFKKYRTWKSFSAWKTLMRRTMLFKTSDFLYRELFMLDPELQLMEVRRKSLSLKLDMVKMGCDRPRTLDDFVQE